MLMGPDAVVYPEQCLVGFVFSELPLDLAGKLQILLFAYLNVQKSIKSVT